MHPSCWDLVQNLPAPSDDHLLHSKVIFFAFCILWKTSLQICWLSVHCSHPSWTSLLSWQLSPPNPPNCTPCLPLFLCKFQNWPYRREKIIKVPQCQAGRHASYAPLLTLSTQMRQTSIRSLALNAVTTGSCSDHLLQPWAGLRCLLTYKPSSVHWCLVSDKLTVPLSCWLASRWFPLLVQEGLQFSFVLLRPCIWWLGLSQELQLQGFGPCWLLADLDKACKTAELSTDFCTRGTCWKVKLLQCGHLSSNHASV